MWELAFILDVTEILKIIYARSGISQPPSRTLPMSYLHRCLQLPRRGFLGVVLALPALMTLRKLPAKAEPAKGFVQVGGWILKRSDLK